MSKLYRIICEELWSLLQWFFLFIPGRIGHYTRGFILSRFFHKSGCLITIKENVEIYHPKKLSVGNRSGFGRNNIIDAIGGIIIGDNVRLGPNVMIATMSHAAKGQIINLAPKTYKKVIIGNNVWIGHGVTILPGVIIGNNVIIAAGAVVSKNVKDGTTVAGIPARPLGE